MCLFCSRPIPSMSSSTEWRTNTLTTSRNRLRNVMVTRSKVITCWWKLMEPSVLFTTMLTNTPDSTRTCTELDTLYIPSTTRNTTITMTNLHLNYLMKEDMQVATATAICINLNYGSFTLRDWKYNAFPINFIIEDFLSCLFPQSSRLFVVLPEVFYLHSVISGERFYTSFLTLTSPLINNE